MAHQHRDTIASEVISSSLGGAISASILYPLEVLKTKMQAGSDDDDDDNIDENGNRKEVGMIEYATKLYEKEGIAVYLKGIETSAFQSAMEKAFYFFAYTTLKQMHQLVTSIADPTTIGKPMGTITNLALGCLAEWAHLPITMPIDCLSTAIQTSSSSPSQKNTSAFALLLTILKEGNMYKGIQAYYVLCFKPALQYTVFEQVKATLLATRKEKSLSAAEAFLLGMVARTIATVAVFPFVRAKVVLQSRKKQQQQQQLEVSNGGGDALQQPPPPQKDPSVMELLGEIYDSGGVPALYRGIGPELTRGVFSAALMLMIKEKINGGVKNALYGDPNHKKKSSMMRH